MAQTRDLASALMMLAAWALLSMGGPAAARALAATMRDGLILAGEAPNFGLGGLLALPRAFLDAAPLLAVVLGVAVLIGAGSQIAQTGPLWVSQALVPNFAKLNPFARLKSMFFSTHTLFELVKSALKVAVLGSLAWKVIAGHVNAAVALPLTDLGAIGTLLADLVGGLLFAIGGGTLVLAGLDYGYQRFQLEKKMRMSKEEAKRERLEHDGNPLFRGMRRQRHRDMSMNVVLKDVKKADVVVTNPTHFAVAIRYRSEEGGAPRIVAKGRDAIALSIRREAVRLEIPVVENKPLARALYKVKVGREVPEKLYRAVAEVLAYIYRLAHRRD